MEAEKPLPKDLSHHFSDVAKAQVPSKIKEFYKFFQIPGITQFAGGLPNMRYFPFDTLEAQTARPDRWAPSPNNPSVDSLPSLLTSTSLTSSGPSAASHITVPHHLDITNPLRKIDLATGLQYGQANGYPPLLSFVRQFVRNALHPNVPYRDGPEVIMSNGSTDGMAKTLQLFTDIWVPGKNDIRERPGLLCEVFMYSTVVGQAAPRGVQAVPVEMDDEGMAVEGPGSLEDVLANWDDSKGKRPHLLYTVTMGHNPTSFILGLKRRKAIYDLCSKYDVVILEDEPYWFLQYPSAELAEAQARNLPIPEPKVANTLEKKSGYPFLDSLAPSFLSIDVDGRVVRLDTFSKTVAPGCRLGWITSSPAIIDRLLRITESSTSQPSGFVQLMMSEALIGSQPEAMAQFTSRSAKDKATFTGWQLDGWVRWVSGLRGQYERRMNRMCNILEEGSYQVKQSTPLREADSDWGVITKTKILDFAWPRGGMFLWVRVNYPTHPLWQAISSTGKILDGPTLSMALMIFLTRKPWLVLASPGTIFGATDKIREERAWSYFRLCFAAEAEDQIDSGTERFAQGIQRFWRIKKVEEIEELLKEAPSAAAEAQSGEMVNMGAFMGC
ncbi:aromatic amino acid aminotransferase [Xylariales sp. PMI_506]|nr:aromatic amino acid aminotransferase [Xylariales sp. PMI_506]